MYTNKYYDLDYDVAHNQIYWTVRGFWSSVDVVPNMEQDWDAVLAQCKKPGFNILADLTEMEMPPDDVAALHVRVQKKIIQAGVSKAAEFTTSAMTRMTVHTIGIHSGLKQLSATFNSIEKAQAWLDEP